MATTSPAPNRRGPYGMTRLQHATLLIIQELTGVYGQAPSLAELGHELDIDHRSQVHRVLTALQARGYIDWLPCQRRSLRVLVPVPFPDELCRTRPLIEILRLPEAASA